MMNVSLKVSEIVWSLGNTDDPLLQKKAEDTLTSLIMSCPIYRRVGIVEAMCGLVFYACRNNHMNIVSFLIRYIVFVLKEYDIHNLNKINKYSGGYGHSIVNCVIEDDTINTFILNIYHYGFYPSEDFKNRCLSPDIAAFMEL